MQRLTAKRVEEILDKLWWRANTWNAIEELAGITDRYAFWKNKTEAHVRFELKALIRERIKKGELTA